MMWALTKFAHVFLSASPRLPDNHAKTLYMVKLFLATLSTVRVGTAKEMIKICFLRGMPKPPPSNVYKLYSSRQLKTGMKMVEVARRWKTERLQLELEKAYSKFTRELAIWAQSKNLPLTGPIEKVAEAYCVANGLVQSTCDSDSSNGNPKSVQAESGFKTFSNRSTDDVTDLGSTTECDSFRVWLGGLPPRITEYAVLQLTRQFGPLSDFHFPVHKVGDARGSTVGYCFITYKDAESVTKALNTLDSLNFHGHTLIARPARPTRDELSVIQRASEEAARLRIAEQAKLREAELAARLQCSESELGKIEQTVTCKLECETNESKSLGLSSHLPSSELAVAPDLYGQLGRVNPKLTSALCKPITRSLKKIDARMAIQKIESALKRLEKTPVGGPALLRPASMQRPLISLGMFGYHPNRSTSITDRGRAPSYRRGGSGYSARTRSRYDK
ncbi:hypothetical protein EG68_11635 [Paragonimus skrjabini miyazakii]|uniref:RRM domain-containing protein n=1 Tax=Paragonimus skrjabini miyazakii TaxID=59628 RepID=A0A8S9YDJ5_9TREM|nr:hypothetical protein EG68_11635 [Paragonimus skrjabini miyazakii]